MNLYLLSQTEHDDYDTYDSCVVAAENAEDARKIHPSPGGYTSYTWASDPKNVTVKLIGVAALGVKAGVVLASFNAG
jgi:hypothetical protein